MPVNYFKAIKAAFYTAAMLVVARWSLTAGDADGTFVFLGAVLFLTVYVTETKDVELAGLLTATFYPDNEDQDDDT